MLCRTLPDQQSPNSSGDTFHLVSDHSCILEDLVYATLRVGLLSTHLHSLMLTPSVAMGVLSVLPLIKYSINVVLPLAGPPTTNNFI